MPTDDSNEFAAIYTYISQLDAHEIDELQARRDGSSSSQVLTDEELAYMLFAEEAQGLLNIRKDFEGDDELSLAEQLAAMEDMARQDREMAIALSEGREPPPRRQWQRPVRTTPATADIAVRTAERSSEGRARGLDLELGDDLQIDEGPLLMEALEEETVERPAAASPVSEIAEGSLIDFSESPVFEFNEDLWNSLLEAQDPPATEEIPFEASRESSYSPPPSPLIASSSSAGSSKPHELPIRESDDHPPPSPTPSLITLVESLSFPDASGKGKAVAAPQIVEVAPPLRVCTICADDIQYTVAELPCGHAYDVDCLRELFRKACTDESLFPPRCCQTAIPPDDVRHHLGPKLFHEFTAKAREFSTHHRVYCHRPTCSAFLGEGSTAPAALACTRCAAKTCTACKEAAHAGEGCSPPSDREVLDLAKKNGWQRCPGCFHLVELYLGCHHMSCVCGKQFCYLCAATWKGCPCPQFAEERLLLQA